MIVLEAHSGRLMLGFTKNCFESVDKSLKSSSK